MGAWDCVCTCTYPVRSSSASIWPSILSASARSPASFAARCPSRCPSVINACDRASSGCGRGSESEASGSATVRCCRTTSAPSSAELIPNDGRRSRSSASTADAAPDEAAGSPSSEAASVITPRRAALGPRPVRLKRPGAAGPWKFGSIDLRQLWLLQITVSSCILKVRMLVASTGTGPVNYFSLHLLNLQRPQPRYWARPPRRH